MEWHEVERPMMYTSKRRDVGVEKSCDVNHRSISINVAKTSLRSMGGLTDGGCACRTAGAPGELKADNVRGGGMGGVIQPKKKTTRMSLEI
jgi:hypothetical protein